MTSPNFLANQASSSNVFPRYYDATSNTSGTFNYRVQPPPDEEEGGASVREPRRPRPGASPAAAACAVPVSVGDC